MPDGSDIVVCAPMRTAVGRFGGALAEVPAATLAVAVLRDIVARTGLAPDAADDVILGQCNPSGEAPAVGRVVALDAGLDIATPGQQVDRRCGSGLQAILQAGMQVASGFSRLVVAGGTESMSQVEHYLPAARWGIRASTPLIDRLERARDTAGGRDHPVPGGMVETAENVRRDHGISRESQDCLALESHRRATAAQEGGLFAAEVVPVTTDLRNRQRTIATDEHVRPGLTMTDLARLKPIMRGSDPDATVTAGNASGQNDGAALCLVTSRGHALALNLAPMARLVGAAVAGTAPETMGIGPVPAVAKLFDKLDLAWADFDLIEVNEAFAAQVLACAKLWHFGTDDFERINVNGSGISLGHPVGATGARIITSALHEMHRRQADRLLVTMCIGGGQGLAAAFERTAA